MAAVSFALNDFRGERYLEGSLIGSSKKVAMQRRVWAHTAADQLPSSPVLKAIGTRWSARTAPTVPHGREAQRIAIPHAALA